MRVGRAGGGYRAFKLTTRNRNYSRKWRRVLSHRRSWRTKVVAKETLRVGIDRGAVADAERSLATTLCAHESGDGIKRRLSLPRVVAIPSCHKTPGIRHLPARLRINRKSGQNNLAALSAFNSRPLHSW